MSAPQERDKGCRACRSCRIRKTKCSRERPACQTCRAHNHTCEYPTAFLKPGPKLGSVHKRRRLDSSSMAPEAEAATEGEHPAVRVHVSPRTPSRTASSSQTSGPAPHDSLGPQDIQSIDALTRLRHEPLPLPSGDGDNDARRGLAELQPGRHDLVLQACHDLGLTPVAMATRVTAFFDSFTSFRLFREPVFFDKLQHIPTSPQLKSLLAAVLIFAFHGRPQDAGAGAGAGPDRPALSAAHFATVAADNIARAIDECGDVPPPLHLLQAHILLTHWRLIRGVRGQAWRDVGLCIRIALELGLHSIDAETSIGRASFPSVQQWCKDEERRRAYWAIFEMDQFANAIKQVTVTMNWTSNLVHLPVEDQCWFSSQPQRSCGLSPELIDRPKDLAATGNKSAKAWFIVFCSFLAEAYVFAYTQGVSLIVRSSNGAHAQAVDGRSLDGRVSIILNAVHLGTLLLPNNLRSRHQRLDFSAPGDPAAGRTSGALTVHRLHAIFQLAMMPHIVRLVTLRPFVLKTYVRELSKRSQNGQAGKAASSVGRDEKTQQCFDAADGILSVELQCDGSHHQYVNPYVGHASWLAATVQLLRQELTEDCVERTLIRSNIEVLAAIYGCFGEYWEMSEVPKQNLDHLTSKLGTISTLLHSRIRRRTPSNPNGPSHIVDAAGSTDISATVHDVDEVRPADRPTAYSDDHTQSHLGSSHYSSNNAASTFLHDGNAILRTRERQEEGSSFAEELFPPVFNPTSSFNHDSLGMPGPQAAETETGLHHWESFYADVHAPEDVSQYLNELFSWFAPNQ